MTRRWRRIAAWTTLGDRMLIALLLIGGAAGAARSGPARRGAEALVRVGTGAPLRLDLAEPRDVRLQGAAGEVVLRIDEGSIRVRESSCRRKVCAAMGPAKRAGEVIVCVPNELIVRVVGAETERGSDEGVDAVLR